MASSPHRRADPSAAASNRVPVYREGLPSRPVRDLYHQVLVASWSTYFGSIIVGFLAVNSLFATAYALQPNSITAARSGSFVDSFFFSVQTMATIGYGAMAPNTLLANILVTIESLAGLLGLAVVTGVTFARFSRPTARVLFSRIAVIAPRDGVPSLMFRVANERANQIVEAQVHVVLARDESTQEEPFVRRFYDLRLARDRNAIFTYTWTIVHPIDETSPLFNVSAAELSNAHAEITVSLMGMDETFAQNVHARHTYSAAEILRGVRLANIIRTNPDGSRTIDYRYFHDTTGGETPS